MLDYWVNPPIEPIVRVYVFNYTNIHKVLSGAEKKIKVNEIGPYVYREHVIKIGLDINDDKISYFVSLSYNLEEHLEKSLKSSNAIINFYRKIDHTLFCRIYLDNSVMRT
jgi:scavenger receptor class B, member 1